MPEKRRGRDPGKPPERKEDDNSYHRAARYPGEEVSEQPYDTMQQLIYEKPCNLSVYRLRLGPQLDYHVAVLGETPPPELQRSIEELLSAGERVTLPQEVLSYLNERRREQQKEGDWVEKHHFPRRRRTK